MLKKIGFLFSMSLFLAGSASFAVSIPAPSPHQILTTGNEYIITPPDKNAIREGTYDIIKSQESDLQVGSLIDTHSKIETQHDATERTIKLIHRLINYALGLVSVIALIVLIFAGIQMITAGGDDTKFKAGNKALKKVTIGIIGLGISWLIVSFIFWVLKQILL